MKKKWKLYFTFCLLGYTIFVLLDTFVIPTAYSSGTSEINYSMFESAEKSESYTKKEAETIYTEDTGGTSQITMSAGSKAQRHKHSGYTEKSGSGNSSEAVSSPDSGQAAAGSSETNLLSGDDASYRDDHIQISIQEYEVSDSTVYVADVRLSSAEYLKTAFAHDTYGKNVTAKTSDIAASKQAILAINGDYYGAQEKGYVIRNGIIYRDVPGNTDVLCINADGSLSIADPSSVTARELIGQGVWQAFSFGPTLVSEGEVAVSEKTEVGRAKASNPRTAIGIIDDLHYLFVVSDGRTEESDGLTLYELASFMRELGVKTAYNLDGGGSSTMVFNGEVINNPTTNGSSIKERSISDIIYIG